jgi:hypothetical protein
VSKPARGFRYPLEPLRSKRQWERDALGHELAKIDGRLATQRERLQESEESLAKARMEWRSRSGENQSLNVGMQRILSAYVADARKAVDTRKTEVTETERSRGAAAERLIKAQRVLDGVERHKTRVAKEHSRGELAKGYRESDADWIQHSGRDSEERR